MPGGSPGARKLVPSRANILISMPEKIWTKNIFLYLQKIFLKILKSWKFLKFSKFWGFYIRISMFPFITRYKGNHWNPYRFPNSVTGDIKNFDEKSMKFIQKNFYVIIWTSSRECAPSGHRERSPVLAAPFFVQKLPVFLIFLEMDSYSKILLR